jgi:hypothetical protein
MALSLAYFLAAGLCEIGGGYLVWLWLREGKSVWLAVLGAGVFVLYGVIPTLQPAHFGRVYAAYGGVFLAGDCLPHGRSQPAFSHPTLVLCTHIVPLLRCLLLQMASKCAPAT